MQLFKTFPFLHKCLHLLVITILCCFCVQKSNAQELSEQEKNFEHLWKEFDQRYALFLPKRIDWNLMYEVYRPKVKKETTDDELFKIMSQMLGYLNDFHVTLVSKDPARMYRSGKSTEIMWDRFGSLDSFYRFFNERPINKKYTQEEIHERSTFAYAWIAKDIGYIHLNGFNDMVASTTAIDEILKYFHNAKNLVIDVRRNGGGDDKVGKAIADRFADKKRLYMITKTKNGPKHDDFSKAKKWFVEPSGKIHYTNPIILLIDLYTMSAAENFALALRVLPHVTIVGDFTSGAYADTETDTLPNGWEFRISTALFVDQNGFCWEGIGVPPDLRIINTEQDIENERDRVLEFAIELINSGALKTYEKERKILK